ERMLFVADAFRAGFSIQEIYDICKIDFWFLAQIEDLVKEEQKIVSGSLQDLDFNTLRRLKRKGFSDKRIAQLLELPEKDVREHRYNLNLHPVYKRVDTCAAEFDTDTAYLYSTYEEECEARPSDRKKVMILGGGPNRIGQGIEFDYCCVHAALALRESGFETIMVNCNPETVSTDFDTSDRLYFEPLTLEDVLEIVRKENPWGVIVHYGGQTPLKLANALVENGVNIIGTSADSIDAAEDRERFQQ
ncbi:carbamoyl phosphate synthase large subunit, partial [Kingella kingae]|nr:carbamoyl phosphate synthase large subunit [Kingella kingae]